MLTTGTVFGGGHTREASLRLTWSFLGLILVADQMLLPMFHAGPIPYKISYFVLGFWGLSWFTKHTSCDSARFQNRDFLRFTTGMAVILGAGLVGELWLSATQSVFSHVEAIRISLFYVLTMLAFGLGLQCVRLDLQWLIRVFYIAVVLTLLFIIFRSQLPEWLTGFYYPESAYEGKARFGVTDLGSWMELARPRGLFGNPNVSAHMVNLLVLFIHLAVRNHLLTIKPTISGVGIVALPIIVAAMLATRGEFIVAVVLGILNYRAIRSRSQGRVQRKLNVRGVGVAILVVIVLVGIFVTVQNNERIRQNIDRIALLINIVSKSDAVDETVVGLSRYLLFIKVGAHDRFLSSPLFGTGFSSASRYPFIEETRYYHNDWARLFVTSGLVGVFAMVLLLWRFAWPLGWPVLIPWVLPGLLNSFMLTIPAFLFYWFMLSVLRQKRRLANRL